MGLFEKKSIFTSTGGALFEKLFAEEPSFEDKVKMLRTDVETEGKKKGFARAADEYAKVFRTIEREYQQTRELLASQKSAYDAQAEAFIAKLEALERKKAQLEKQVQQKSRDVSEKYDIPVSQVQSSLAAGNFLSGSATIDILGILYRHKEKKLREAERRGYLEAKELYEAKIDSLKAELEELRIRGSADMMKMVAMIRELLDAIAEEEMKIAELKILL